MYRLQFSSAGGGTTSFDGQTVVRIGRGADNDIVLDATGVSEHHAELRPTDNGWVLHDTGSAEGTWVGGQRVSDAPLGATTTVHFGAEGSGVEATIAIDSTATAGVEDPAYAPAAVHDPERTVLPADLDSTPDGKPDALLIRTRDGDTRVDGSKTTSIGRDADSDVVADDPVVSRQHAEVQRRDDRWWYLDHSNSGSFIDGEKIDEKEIEGDTVVQLGHPSAGYQLTLIPVSDVESAQKEIVGKRWRRRGVLVAAAVTVVALVAAGIVASILLNKKPTPNTLTAAELDRAKHASVQIIAYAEDGLPAWSGSGSVISSDGLILTNAHVAAPNAKGLGSGDAAEPAWYTVGFAKDENTPAAQKYRAKTLVADGYLDLAVMKIDANADGSPLPGGKAELPEPMLVGDSNALHTGDRVTTLGYPGLTSDEHLSGPLTVTSGDVSAFKRDYATNTDRFWIDMTARIAHGNSGGASVNIDGQLVGVNTQFQKGVQGEPGASFLTRPSALAADVIRVAQKGGDPNYVSPMLDKIQKLPDTATATAFGWGTTRSKCESSDTPGGVTHLSGVNVGDTVFASFLLREIPNDAPFAILLVDADNGSLIDMLNGIWAYGEAPKCINAPVEYKAGLKHVMAIVGVGYQFELEAKNVVSFD